MASRLGTVGSNQSITGVLESALDYSGEAVGVALVMVTNGGKLWVSAVGDGLKLLGAVSALRCQIEDEAINNKSEAKWTNE